MHGVGSSRRRQRSGAEKLDRQILDIDRESAQKAQKGSGLFVFRSRVVSLCEWQDSHESVRLGKCFLCSIERSLG